MSLGQAAELLGIAPGTLRRWADDGRVPVFTTPGGHRRFSRSSLASMLPSARAGRPPLSRLGASPERVTRAYRGRRSLVSQPEPWIAALSDGDRLAFRERGRELVSLLLDHLDRPDAPHAAGSGPGRLRDAERLAAQYGRDVAALGSSLAEAVQGFLRFRSPFIDELSRTARRRGLDTAEATALLADAEAAMDRLLIAMMTGHSLEAGSRRARRAPPSRRPSDRTGAP